MNQQQIFINAQHNPQLLQVELGQVQRRDQLPMGNVSFVLVQSTEVDEIALRLRYGNMLVPVVRPMSIHVASMLPRTEVISRQLPSRDAVESGHSNQRNESDTEPMDIDY